MKKKILVILLSLVLSSSLFAQNIRFIPSFLFDSGYSYTSFNKDIEVYKQLGTNISSHNFYTKLDGTFQMVVPKTFINLDYTIQWNFNDKINFDINKLWAKFILGDWASLQIGRYFMNWSEGLVWNVSDFINNQPKWNSSNVKGKDGLDININLPFNSIPMNLNIATLYFKDIKDLSVYFLVGAMLYPVDMKLKCAVYYDKAPSVGLSLKTSLGNLDISLDSALLFSGSIKEKYGYKDNNYKIRVTPELKYYIPIGQNHEIDILASYLFQSDGLTKNEGTAYLKNLDLDKIRLISQNYFKSYRQYLNTNISYSYKNVFNANLGLKINLEDFSGAIISGCSYMLLHNIKLSPMVIILFRNDNSESSTIPYNYTFSFSISKKI